MSVTHFILHRLEPGKEKHCEAVLSDAQLPLSHAVQDLTDQLKSAFLGRLGRLHGTFAETATEAGLEQPLHEFLENQISFVDFSGRIARGLAAMLSEEERATTVHLLLFMEKTNQEHVMNLFLVSEKTVAAINEAFLITTTSHLDFGPSLAALRVNVRDWKGDQDYSYLSLVAPKGRPDLASAFETFVGFSKGKDKQEQTETFLEGVEAFASQVPEDKQGDYRRNVVEFCMDQDAMDAPVDMNGLTEVLGENIEGIDTREFGQFMDGYTPQGAGGGYNGGLRTDSRSLKQYIKFAGRERDLAISFSSDQLDKRVKYDQPNDQLSIIGLPKSLREQLLRHRGQ